MASFRPRRSIKDTDDETDNVEYMRPPEGGMDAGVDGSSSRIAYQSDSTSDSELDTLEDGVVVDEDDLERASLFKPTYDTVTDFTWVNIAARLYDVAPSKARGSVRIYKLVVIAISLNNYAYSQGLDFQFRWYYDIRKRASQELYMVRKKWTNTERQYWATSTAMGRQFECSIENVAWAEGWVDNQVLRIAFASPDGVEPCPRTFKHEKKKDHILLRAVMDKEDNTYGLFLSRPADKNFKGIHTQA